MGAGRFEVLTKSELRDECEARGITQFPGESRRQLMKRMADYDSTVEGARVVAVYGLFDGRRS